MCLVGCFQPSQPHGMQPLSLRIPVGMVLMAWSLNPSSTREELLSAGTCHSLGALGSGLASVPCGNGAGSTARGRAGGRGGLFITSLTRSHLHRAHSCECHWHICSETQVIWVQLSSEIGFRAVDSGLGDVWSVWLQPGQFAFLPSPLTCPVPCSQQRSITCKAGRAGIFESYSPCSHSVGKVAIWAHS